MIFNLTKNIYTYIYEHYVNKTTLVITKIYYLKNLRKLVKTQKTQNNSTRAFRGKKTNKNSSYQLDWHCV